MPPSYNLAKPRKTSHSLPYYHSLIRSCFRVITRICMSAACHVYKNTARKQWNLSDAHHLLSRLPVSVQRHTAKGLIPHAE